MERRTTSGDGGTFAFADLPIGPYDVEVTGRDGLHAWARIDVTTLAKRIQLYATERLSLGHVSVRVVDEAGTAVPFAEVTLAVGSNRAGWFGWDERAPFRGTCDAHGRFALRDRPELAPIEMVSARALDGAGRVGLAFVNFGTGQGTWDVASIEVVLHAPGSLRGALTGLADYTGLQALAQPWLGYAFAAECFATSAQVAADGSFEIRGLPPLEHRVQVTGGARRADNEQFWNTQPSLVPAGGSTTTDPATIVCSSGSRVRGCVRDAGGAPVAGVRVTALRPWIWRHHHAVHHPDERSASHWFARSRTTTDAAGRYELALYPGTWQVVVADGDRLHAQFPVIAGAEPVLEIEHRLAPGGALAGDMCHGNALRSATEPDVIHLLGSTPFVMRGLLPGTWELGRCDRGAFVARHTVEIVAGKTLWLAPMARDEREHRGVLRHGGQPLADHDVSIGDRGEPVRTGADGAFVLRHVHDGDADGGKPSLCVRYRSLLIANVPQLDGDVEVAGRMIEVHTSDAQGTPLPATIAIGDTFEEHHPKYETYNGPGRIDAPNGHLRCLLTRIDEHTSVVATFADGSRSLARIGDRTVVRLVRPTTGSLRVRALDAAGLPCPGQHIQALTWGQQAPPPNEAEAFVAGCADAEDRVESTCGADGIAELRGVPVGPTLVTVWRDGMRTRATHGLVTVAADRLLDVEVRPAK